MTLNTSASNPRRSDSAPQPALQPAQLYWLDLLLTADAEHAESAMLAAVPCFERPSWSLPAFVGQAIHYVHRELAASVDAMCLQHAAVIEPQSATIDSEYDLDRLTAAVLQIETFPRCVLVLKLFQKMTINDISSYLKVNTQLLKQAFAAGAVQLHNNLLRGSAAGVMEQVR